MGIIRKKLKKRECVDLVMAKLKNKIRIQIVCIACNQWKWFKIKEKTV